MKKITMAIIVALTLATSVFADQVTKNEIILKHGLDAQVRFPEAGCEKFVILGDILNKIDNVEHYRAGKSNSYVLSINGGTKIMSDFSYESCLSTKTIITP